MCIDPEPNEAVPQPQASEKKATVYNDVQHSPLNLHTQHLPPLHCNRVVPGALMRLLLAAQAAMVFMERVMSEALIAGRMAAASCTNSHSWAARGFRARGRSSALVVRCGSSTTLSTYDAVAERIRWGSRLAEAADEDAVTPVLLLEKQEWEQWRSTLTTAQQTWVDAMLPRGWKAGSTVSFANADSGELVSVVSCADGPLTSPAKVRDALAKLAGSLPTARLYRLTRADGACETDGAAATLGWCLGAYSFEAYKSSASSSHEEPSRLEWPVRDQAREAVKIAVSATYLVRDLISTPAEDMGPAALERTTHALAAQYGAETSVVSGDALLEDNFPMVHAVGRAAAVGREPRLVTLDWTPPGASDDMLPLVVLVGKGVTFDTGGLDLKPPQAMLTMKKDMGGAAHCLGLADMIMGSKLPVRLKVLLGCVENSVSGAAFRPGDILIARNGATTEIANTDAEGRLVLGDLLVLAEESDPDLIVDIATLTGAGRVALGTAIPALFCNDDSLANRLQDLSSSVHDELWRLPLWHGYEAELDSKIADCKNVGSGPYGGAITAALYLQRFLKKKENGLKQTPWIHIDVMAYNTKTAPGRPEGGEAMGMRSLFALIRERYASPNFGQ